MKQKTQTSRFGSKLQDFTNDQQLVCRTFAQFPSGISLLAVHQDGEKHAMVASSFMVGVSLDPCLVAVAVQKDSVTWQKIRQAGLIGVSIFGHNQGPWVRQLASKERAKRFDNVVVEASESGGVYLHDAAMWLETTIYQETAVGDHWMVSLEVSRLGVDEDTEPLLWHGSRFRSFAVDPSLETR